MNVFISYDFGMKGDYEGLFKWLDEHHAEERGYGIGMIKDFQYDKTIIKTDLDLFNYVKDELKIKIKIGSTDRIYMIWDSVETSKIQAGFLFGKSKQAPWTGYAPSSQLDKIELDIQ